ncbi:MAG: hypothetical protein M0C28_15430 [Candidatus Moduliflexus flocculans]|nr:hypothetical protein [Candidatus Moduliflexus flocculans]
MSSRPCSRPPAQKEKNGEKLEGPVRLKGSGEPLNLSFRNEVSLRSIFQTLGRLAGVNFLYDDTFRDTNLAIDLTGKDLQQAVNFLCVASKNFSRVIDERTVIIVPDNVQKRMQYELNAIKTFYLSNIDASDVQMRLTQMVKTQYKVPTIQVDKNLNSVTIRDTPQAVALAEKLLRQWDKSKGEVAHRHRDHGGRPDPGEEPRHRPQQRGPRHRRLHPRETASMIRRLLPDSRASTSATWPTTR